MAFLRQASLLTDRAERKRLIKALSIEPTSLFVFEELVVKSIQLALEDGDLEQAYRFARVFWRRAPDADYLNRASQLFDRVLLLEFERRLAAKDYYGVLDLFYSEEAQIKKHRTTGLIYLEVAKVLRTLGMIQEATHIIQDGMNNRDPGEPELTTAELYRELATLLRLDRDKFRLKEIDAYLSTRFPRTFDDPEYWLAKVYNLAWSGKPKDIETARKILVYALNGDISDDERLMLMQELIDFDATFNMRPETLVKSLDAFLKEYDRNKKPRIGKARSRALWRIAETWLDAEVWDKSILALRKFLTEYPDHSNRVEARFFLGRAYLRFGDVSNARRYWDLVAREDADGVFGRLAKLELEMLAWEQNSMPALVKKADL